MTLHYARRLTQKGLDRLAEIIHGAHEAMRHGRSVEVIDEESLEDAKELLGLDDDTNEFSERMPAAYAFMVDDEKSFKTQYELADYLHSKVPQEFRKNPWDSETKGMWEWLALFYAEQFRGDGRKPLFGRDRLFWIADSRMRFRHYTQGPFLAYAYLHRNKRVASIFLNAKLGIFTELYREFCARDWLISCESAVEVAVRLYWDPIASRWKERHATRGPLGAGAVRRLVEVLGQFDLTYDLHSLSADELYNMLPKEFDRFKGTPESAAVAR